MSRWDRLEKRLIDLEGRLDDKKRKKFKTGKLKRLFRKAKRLPEHVVIVYLTRQYEIKLKLCRIISGNLVVVENKVHVLNPKHIWSWGKHRTYIVREIDRQPVSNEDYDEVVRRGDDTDEDKPLIKAVLGATQKKAPMASKNVWIVIGIIVVIIVISLLIFG